MPVKDIKGAEVITIEGLGRNGRPHPVQKAFIEHNALQCGYCTSGMIMNAYAFLLAKPKPTKAAIIRGKNTTCAGAAVINVSSMPFKARRKG
jgi:aerobic-type carbon monoxide dehydrogenase small subunit (CoxS/CutS family)